MISIGEETGELDSMMMKVADFYEDEVEQAVKALTSIIEPLMMVGLAGMVAVILLSMYLPLFKVFETLG
jgi:type IV pilus assembly protein PilC